MKTFHILNGDCLAEQLRHIPLEGEIIICRECLIDGNVCAENIADFWETRANYLSSTYNITSEEYFNKTVSEFEKLRNIPDNSEVYLWFENDLFCQTNMWFLISLLAQYPDIKIFRVFPVLENNNDLWKGFGQATSEKHSQAFASKVQFTNADIELGENLWQAYQMGNLNELSALSRKQSNCFDYLEKVCQAHIDRFPSDNSIGRPEKVIKEIIETCTSDFNLVCAEFATREGIYGFGDLQLKTIFNRLMKLDA